MIDIEFENRKKVIESFKADLKAVLDKYKSTRADYEKEQAEKAEAEKLRIEEAATLKAEREELKRLMAEQEKSQAAINAENNRIKREQQKLDEDKIAIEIERQRDIELKQAVADAAENARLKAIEEARWEAEEKEGRLQAAKNKAEREAVLRPDIENLHAFLSQFGEIVYFNPKDIKIQELLDEVKRMVSDIQSYIIVKVKQL